MRYNTCFNAAVPIFFAVILSVMLVASCAEKRPEKVEIKEKSPQKKVPIKEEKPEKTEEKRPSLFEVLVREARKFIREGEIRDALVFYNKALSLASESEKKGLMENVKDVLGRADTDTLRELSRTKELFIPKALILYRLASALALEENYKGAAQTIETFEEKYPDHPLAGDVAKLKLIVEKSRFNRGLIGCLLPLTGKYSIFGKRALNGIELAVKDFRKNHPDRNIRIVIKDTGSNKKQAVSRAEELAGMEVAALIGPMGTGKAAGGVAKENGIPMMAMTQKELNIADESFLFSNFLNPRLQAKALASYACYRLGIRNFAILYPEDDYGKTYMNFFWDMVDAYGGQIKGVESYGPDQTDFSEILEKITGEFYKVPEFMKENPEEYENILFIKDKDEEKGEDENRKQAQKEAGRGERGKKDGEKIKFRLDFEAVFIPDSHEKVSMILPQLAFHDIEDVTLLGTNLWHDKRLVQDASGYTDNALITSGFYPKSSINSKARRFADDYRRLYGKLPGFIEAVAYDSASIVLESLLDESIKSREDLRNAIAGGMFFNGATGKTYFDRNGDLHKELFYLTIEKEEFTEITRSTPLR